MKILKLLNNNYLSIILIILLFISNVRAEDKPVDIWNIDQDKIKEGQSNNNPINNEILDSQTTQPSIYDLQSQKEINTVQVDASLDSKDIEILGIYDPEDYNLQIDMWSNSDGDQLKYLFSNLSKMNLSKDASELMNIALLTNSYYPEININAEEFLKIKSDWLIKNKNRDLIEQYLIKNQILNLHPELSRYLVDQYLSESNVEKACDLFLKNNEVIENVYLSKFNLYCLIYEGKTEEAQLIFDLKKELGFKDKYFEKKINYLLGFVDELNLDVSEKSILDFHLAHRTIPDFVFEPKQNTNPLIWKYLATSNLLYNIEEIDINELDKIALIEKATHDKNYSEQDLFNLYKRFQFNINQLINAKDVFKNLPSYEGRALMYQKLLLTSDTTEILELSFKIKESLLSENLGNAFQEKLAELLSDISYENVPSNYTTFYINNLNSKDEKKILKLIIN